MSAQVEFFCSPSEERQVLQYLTEQGDIQVFDVTSGRLSPWESFSAENVSAWPQPLAIDLWQPVHGSLIWHTTVPAVDGPTHRSLVINLFAHQEWNARGLADGDRMLDSDLSPILHYHRGSIRDGKIGPCSVLAPPSNLQRVSLEYERWVKRSLAWIRRRGKIVHDWRQKSTTIPNLDMLLNTIYAFPDAQEELKSNNHKFAIFLQDRP
jgi:hypothetical protein